MGIAIQAFSVRSASVHLSSDSEGQAAFQERTIEFFGEPIRESDKNIVEGYLHRSNRLLLSFVADHQHIEPVLIKPAGTACKPVAAFPSRSLKNPLRSPPSRSRLAIPQQPKLKRLIKFTGRMQRHAFSV
jgi:hypothetical protein